MSATAVFARMLRTHFITIVLIVVFGVKLYNQKKAKNAELRYFWMTLICCFLLVIEDAVEAIAASDPDLRLLRTTMSVIGYVLRPTAVLGLLLVICPQDKRTWRVWIPNLVNLAVFLTAFFSPIAFSFDQDYAFTRGPLGGCVIVVAFLYMVQILILSWRRFYDRKRSERWILILCAASCIVGTIIDMAEGGSRLNESLMVSCVFFNLFLCSHDNRLDPLTDLENRFAFCDDMRHQQKDITAIASLDMNGLKRINDTQGHAEGDKALAAIGRCLNGINNRNTAAYRIGGDEFAILFFKQGEDSVRRTVLQACEAVKQAGFSLSAGYAMREGSERVEDALIRSDRSMYADKADYYRQSGMDRRRR